MEYNIQLTKNNKFNKNN